MTATAARSVFPGEDWAFHEHRTMAEVATQGRPGIGRPDVSRRNTRRITLDRARAKLLARDGREVGKVLDNVVPDHEFDEFLGKFW